MREAEQGIARSQWAYQYYDKNIDGKVIKLNGELSTERDGSGRFEGGWVYVKKDETDEYSTREWVQVPVPGLEAYKDQIIGKLTGNWSDGYEYAVGRKLIYEVKLFNPTKNAWGYFTYWVDLVIREPLAINDYSKRILVLEDDGTITGQVYKCHQDRAIRTNYFPHHDPDYPSLDCEKWDKYFGNIPWTGVNSPMYEREHMYMGGVSLPWYGKLSIKPWHGYSFVPNRNVNCYWWDHTNFGGAIKIIDGQEVAFTFFNEDGDTRVYGDATSTSFWPSELMTPWLGGQIWNWGVCLSASPNPTKGLNTVFDFKQYVIGISDLRYNPKQSAYPVNDYRDDWRFTGLLPNTTYYIKMWEEVWGDPSIGEDPEQRYLKYSTQGIFATNDIISNPHQGIWTRPFAVTQTSVAFRIALVQRGDNIDEYGVCYKAGESQPTINDSKKIITDQDRASSNIVQITGLNPGTKYTFLPYAIRNKGLSNQEVFYTNLNAVYNLAVDESGPANVFTTASGPKSKGSVEMYIQGNYSNATSIQVGYRLKDNGNTVITDEQVGVCYNTSGNPTISDTKIFDNMPGSREEYEWRYAGADNLNPEQKYYFRAFVTNSEGTAYSDDVLEQSTAKKLTPDEIITFFALENSTTKNSKNLLFGAMGSNSVMTEMGVCYSKTQNPTIANNKEIVSTGNGSKTVTLTGLDSNATYYYRGYFIDEDGVSYSKQLSFTTLKNIVRPAISSVSSTSNSTSVILSTNISSDGGSTATNYIAYTKIRDGLTLSRPNFAYAMGNGIGAFTATVLKTALSSGTWYYCSYSTNEIGTTQSEIKTFVVEDLVTKSLPVLFTVVDSIKPTSAYWNTRIESLGNSELVSASILIKRTSDNYQEYVNDAPGIPNEYSIISGLLPNTSYTLTFTVRTQYTVDNALPDVVSTKIFTTPEAPTDPTAPLAPIIKLFLSEKKGAECKLTISTENVINNAIVRLCGSLGSVPEATIAGQNAEIQIGLNNLESQTKVVTIPRGGIWKFRVVLFDPNGSSRYYSSNILEININQSSTSDGDSMFPLYPSDGEAKIIKGKRFVYSAIDNGWQRDYLYNPTASPSSTLMQARASATNEVAQLTETINQLRDQIPTNSLDRIPKVGEKIDGFEVVKVFYSSDSDIDLFGSGDVVGVVLVNFDQIVDFATYSDAKYRAMAFSAELMPLNKYPHIVGFIKEKAGLENGTLIWSELENDNNEAFAYEVNDEGDARGQWLTKEESEFQITTATAIPVRIITVPKYLTNFFALSNTTEYLFQYCNSENKSFVGDIQHIRVTLKRKYNHEIVSTVESNIELAQNILITDTKGYSKIEYVIKTELRTNITLGFGYLVWIDSINISGCMDISDADYELLVSTI